MMPSIGTSASLPMTSIIPSLAVPSFSALREASASIGRTSRLSSLTQQSFSRRVTPPSALWFMSCKPGSSGHSLLPTWSTRDPLLLTPIPTSWPSTFCPPSSSQSSSFSLKQYVTNSMTRFFPLLFFFIYCQFPSLL